VTPPAVRIVDDRRPLRDATARFARRLAPGFWEARLQRQTLRNAARAQPIIDGIIAGVAARGAEFDRVEIETISRCNNTCEFCPVNRRVDPRPRRLMTEQLFDRIIGMLGERRFRGGFALFSNNEPLLDSRIEDLAARAREALPDACHYLYTNGTLLTVDRFERLMPSLHHLTINNYDNDGRLLPTVRAVYEYAKAHLRSGAVDIHMRRSDELLTTRAGTAPNRGLIRPLAVSCFLPFSQLIIRPDGKVSQCCEDALGRATLGDLSCQTLSEAWNSPERKLLQARIRRGRAEDPLCRGCDTLDLNEQEQVI
jgi:radical SAM protein with 4Fe4S-binding SPASM domain